MNFKVFVESVVQQLQQKMGTDYEIRVMEVMKNNDVRLTGIIMMRQADRISPTIYLEEYYREYCAGAGLGQVVDSIVRLYMTQVRGNDLDMSFFSEYTCVRNRIFHKVINYEKNRKLLENVPHFRWCDLAVVFYYAMEKELIGRATILIHNSHLAMWGQSVDALYRTAQSNMKRCMPELLVPMQELLGEMAGIRLEENTEISLYVLTNREKFYGASAMLYSEQMAALADEMQSDLLILPSSVHEVLILPDDRMQGYDCYSRMVEEVNTTQVEPEEILSYSLYRYDRENAEIKEIIV